MLNYQRVDLDWWNIHLDLQSLELSPKFSDVLLSADFGLCGNFDMIILYIHSGIHIFWWDSMSWWRSPQCNKVPCVKQNPLAVRLCHCTESCSGKSSSNPVNGVSISWCPPFLHFLSLGFFKHPHYMNEFYITICSSTIWDLMIVHIWW